MPRCDTRQQLFRELGRAYAMPVLLRLGWHVPEPVLEAHPGRVPVLLVMHILLPMTLSPPTWESCMAFCYVR